MNQISYSRDKNRSKWRTIGSTILLVILILAFLGLITVFSQIPSSSDFLKFYSSIRFWLDNQSIYTPLTLETIPGEIPIDPDSLNIPIHPNLNPPIQTLLFSPLSLFRYEIAYSIWSLVSLILGLAAVYLIFDAYRNEIGNFHVFELSIIFLFFFPTFLTIFLGQVSNLILFFITFAWVSARKGSDRVSGIMLGIVLSLKIFTGLFIPVFMIQRRWKLLGWIIGTFFLLNLASVLIVGLDEHVTYLQTISSITWYSSSWNPSLMGLLTRIFGGAESIPPIDAPSLGLILFILIALGVTSMLMWSTYKQDNKSKYGFDLIFSLTIVSMLFLSPLGWSYYYVLLVIPLVVAGYLSWRLCDNLLIGLIIISWIFCTIPYQQILGQDLKPIDIFTWAGFPLYGLLIFLSVLIVLTRKLRNNIQNSNFGVGNL